MDISGKGSLIKPTCLWCMGEGKNRCSRCHNAYYCCRDHQVQHWPAHKKVCKKIPLETNLPPPTINAASSNANFGNFGKKMPVQQDLPPPSMNPGNSRTNLSNFGKKIPVQENLLSSAINPANSNLNLGNFGKKIPLEENLLFPTINTANSSINMDNFGKKMPVQESLPPSIVNSANSSVNLDTFNTFDNWCQNNLPCTENPNIEQAMNSINAYNPSTVENNDKYSDFSVPTDEEIFSTLSSELLSSANNFWDIINTCDTQNMSFDYNMYLEKDKNVDNLTQALGANSYSNIVTNEQSANLYSTDGMQCVSLNDICANVVHDLNAYGICVLDKFIGSKLGDLIFDEVKYLYHQGIFQKGELVNSNPFLLKENIRSDVTTWVNGTEDRCRYIGSLIKKLDLVVTTCNKMPNNGLLSQYKLHRRTKAMLACYPGDGTYYKKHIDNPNQDGRCITCIYYLNKDWDVKTHGGLLRMFPSAHDSQVANIEPIFDRMLFFWSDKRNPHEVLPSYATRFAITVWYFDADERDRALMKSRVQHFIQ